jgi:hypothetical protein
MRILGLAITVLFSVWTNFSVLSVFFEGAEAGEEAEAAAAEEEEEEEAIMGGTPMPLELTGGTPVPLSSL